jgi:hypothetical protein
MVWRLFLSIPSSCLQFNEKLGKNLTLQEARKFLISNEEQCSKDFATKLYKTYLENAIEGKYRGKSNQVATFTKRKS